MRTDSPRALWMWLLLTMALLSTGCVSVTLPPNRGMNLRYTQHEAAAPSLADVAGTAGGAVPHNAAEPAQRSATGARQALLGAVLDVSGSTRRISSELSSLKASRAGIAGRYTNLFGPFVDHGLQQLRW
ncbi:MAG TPA: DUF2380 domain-containing protein, partial [Archangium sp.]